MAVQVNTYLLAGSIFGVSALTFGKWQLVASLGAVVFRTVGGPTILSSILRTPGQPLTRIKLAMKGTLTIQSNHVTVGCQQIDVCLMMHPASRLQQAYKPRTS